MDVLHLGDLSDVLVLYDAGLMKSEVSLVNFTDPSSVICPSKRVWSRDAQYTGTTLSADESFLIYYNFWWILDIDCAFF